MQESSDVPQKRWRRIIPVAFLMYTIAFIDRNNISFAFPGIQHDLAIDATYAGMAAGIFFIGYLFLQIPGAIIAEKFGAKRFVTVALIVWGIVSMSTGLVQNVHQLLGVRFLLGVVEGGVSPATMILLSKWFPLAERSQANAYWYLCIPFSSIVMSPLCGLILTYADWRMMFFLEGLPPLIWAVVWWYFIDDDPATATWLPEPEREYLTTTLTAERQAIRKQSGSTREALTSPNLWILVVVFFLIQIGFYGYGLWLPTLVRSVSGGNNMTVGLLSALPWIAGMAGALLMARHVDVTGKRQQGIAIAMIGGAFFLLLSVMFGQPHPVLAIGSMVLCMGFLYSYIGVFWATPTTFLTGTALGAGIGIINSLGNLGGFLGPFAVGFLIDRTHSFITGVVFLAGALVAAGLLIFLFRARPPVVAQAAE